MMQSRLNALCATIQAWRGKKVYAFAAFSGALLTLGFPPFWLLPIALLALTLLIWQVQAAESGRQAFWLGWWFGLGHFVTGVYWITIALGVDGGKFLWLVPFALLLLPAYLAIYIGLACVALHHANKRLSPAGAVLLFAVSWVLLEYIRSWLMTGFPWNLLGYVWTLHDAALQTASLVGVYGLSFWALLLAGGFSLLTKPKAARGYVLPIVLVLTVGLTGWGYTRLADAPAMEQQATEDAVNVRIVQANATQSEKWDPRLQMQTVRRHLELSRQASTLGKLDYIIWPETAMPFSFDEGSQWADVLSRDAPPTGALLTGVVRYEDAAGDEWRAWNSIQALNYEGQIIGVYDKSKLVPFGEFLPLRWLLSTFGLEKVAHGIGDFTSGNGAQQLYFPQKQMRVTPLICYEAIFPIYRPKPSKPSNFILNITNDEWFGRSTGPRQHLHMARTRAVEQGVPLVRAANSGISAVFDAYGREQKRLGLGEVGVVDARIPVASIVPTWYSRHGEQIILTLLLLTLALACFMRQRKPLE